MIKPLPNLSSPHETLSTLLPTVDPSVVPTLMPHSVKVNHTNTVMPPNPRNRTDLVIVELCLVQLHYQVEEDPESRESGIGGVVVGMRVKLSRVLRYLVVGVLHLDLKEGEEGIIKR